MGLFGWIFYIILGIVFFVLLTIIQSKYSITKLEKLVISLIFMMITSGICYKYAINCCDNIFLVFVFMLITDVIYSSYFVEKDFFDRNEKNLLYYVTLIVIAFFINQEFINQVSKVFLTGEDLRIVLWLLVIIFIYNFCSNNKVFSNTTFEKERRMGKETILINYTKLRYRYGDICNHKNKDVNNLVYSIMIFENNRRGKILRNYDYFLFKINGGKKKLGIMQVNTNKFITDKESIELVYKKIDSKLKKGKFNIKDYLKDYKKEEIEYIEYIFDTIKKF